MAAPPETNQNGVDAEAGGDSVSSHHSTPGRIHHSNNWTCSSGDQLPEAQTNQDNSNAVNPRPENSQRCESCGRDNEDDLLQDSGNDEANKIDFSPKKWPLPSEVSEDVVDTATNESCVDPSTMECESWWNEGAGQPILTRYHKFWQSEHFSRYHDVIFQVGPEKERMSGHRLILSVTCENELFNRSLSNSFKDGFPISLPDVSPEAFGHVLKYIYTREIKFENLQHGISVLKVAKSLGIPELQSKCVAFLTASINNENAMEMFCSALESQDDQFTYITTSYITRNICDVLSSNAFLQLSQESLHQFLHSNEWFIEDELHVFRAVIRWATQNLSGATVEDKPSGAELRKFIGDALYEIRLTSLSSVTTFLMKMDAPYRGLFTPDESIAISRYIAARTSEEEPENSTEPPPKFNILPRVKREIIDYPSSTTENVAENQLDDNQNDRRELGEESQPSTNDNNEGGIKQESNVNTNTDNVCEGDKINVDVETVVQPRTPKRKRERSDSEGNNSASKRSAITAPESPPAPCQQVVSNKAKVNLNNFVKSLGNREDFRDIMEIKETVLLSAMPQSRVYLPNLKRFNLTLVASRHFDCGSALKQYMKSKLNCLSDILFFNTNDRDSERGSESGETQRKAILKELLSSKVDITITLRNIVFLKINHDEGLILMNLIKDAQEILARAQDFPLKILALSDCELYSLDHINKQTLNTIVMRRVKGFKNHASFLQSCTNLRTVSWHDLGSGELNLTENLLNGNRFMKKLALAKCKLSVTGSFDNHQNYLKELYLDNCDFKPDVISAMPNLFPYVKRVQLYGKQCNASLLHTILQMPSLEWVFMWEFTYCKVRSGRKQKGSVLTEESQRIQQLLSSIFDPDFAKKESITFILEKRKEHVTVSPGTSSSALQQKARDPFDAAFWDGRKFRTSDEKYKAIGQLDFKNFAYDSFFSSYDEYCFFETSEAEAKKKRRKTESNKNSGLNPTTIEMVEPVSNGSTDEAIDVVESC